MDSQGSSDRSAITTAVEIRVREYAFFVRVPDAVFWADNERVSILITFYQHYECLWDYKNIHKKKLQKLKSENIWASYVLVVNVLLRFDK